MRKTLAAIAASLCIAPVFNEKAEAQSTLTPAADEQYIRMICERGSEFIEIDKQYTASGRARGRTFGFHVDEQTLHEFWGNYIDIPEGQEFPSHEHIPLTMSIADEDITAYVRFVRIREEYRDEWDDYYTIEIPFGYVRPLFLQMYEYGITPDGWLCERVPYVAPERGRYPP